MKSIFFLVGGIAVFTIAGFAYAHFTNDEQKQLQEKTELADETLGLMTSSEDKQKEAIAILQKPNHSPEEQQKAVQLVQESIEDAKKATQAQPENASTWFYLSEAYAKMWDVDPKAADLAIDALNRSIELSPESPELYNKRATAFIFKKNYTSAEKDLQKAIELNPNSANYYYKMGNVYKETNRFEQARRSYEQAKKLNPNSEINNKQIEIMLEELEKKATQAGEKR